MTVQGTSSSDRQVGSRGKLRFWLRTDREMGDSDRVGAAGDGAAVDAFMSNVVVTVVGSTSTLK